MRMQKLNKRKSGFTLIELMVVIAIMGIISAVAVPNILGMVEKSKEKVDLLKLYHLRDALNRALIENGSALYNNASVADSILDKALKSKTGVDLFIIEMRPDLPGNVQNRHSNINGGSQMSKLVGSSGTWYEALRTSSMWMWSRISILNSIREKTASRSVPAGLISSVMPGKNC